MHPVSGSTKALGFGDGDVPLGKDIDDLADTPVLDGLPEGPDELLVPVFGVDLGGLAARFGCGPAPLIVPGGLDLILRSCLPAHTSL